ncbi:hypothetical protein MGYG_09049 [Nannizzia gypsea CBS 118893]|uniref:Uncharacterized protein n=1 Tax=Arthroderma gypseum (strain ATCC MYA-4604 / CBS 118893) TaxID=535722 RepID=E4UTH7_ARTGP|nr:hypothetical protein MGYG_09049 [Nannizzia gypsea CBS 118893]EFR01522.1 hypothetical protein MGYG_09049 [Nannizzia gypsea CBS 118893]
MAALLCVSESQPEKRQTEDARLQHSVPATDKKHTKTKLKTKKDEDIKQGRDKKNERRG